MAASPLIVPSGFGGITYTMLHSALSGCEIIYKPLNVRRTFRWFESVYGDELLNTFDNQQCVLVLCQKEFAKTLLEQNSEAFCIALSPDNNIPDWVCEFSYKSRVIIIRQQKRFAQYATLFNELFTSNLIWENEMDRVVFKRENLDKLIEVSEAVLNNFLCITDTGYNLISCSRQVDPPKGARAYLKLMSEDCYDPFTIKQIEEHVLTRTNQTNEPVILEPNQECDFPTLHYPIYIDDLYLFHVAMVCETSDLNFLKDLFKKFVKRVTMEAHEFWRTTVNLEAPWHRLLLSLIDGKIVTQDYLTTQLANTDIPDAKSFRVIYVPFDKETSHSKQLRIVEASKKLNGGSVYPFMRRGSLVVLCYSLEEGESHLSGKKLWSDVTEVLYKPFDARVGASQLFTNIQDLDKAFAEATIAYGLRGPLIREYESLMGNKPVPVFPFEHALKFYMLMEGHDDGIVDFAFKGSILSHLVREDVERGTDLAQMVWVYISHGRNATETGRMVHMHRNTVLYHLSRIEERFDISFDSPLLRSRLVLDYQRLLLEESI